VLSESPSDFFSDMTQAVCFFPRQQDAVPRHGLCPGCCILLIPHLFNREHLRVRIVPR
jgi:hypothetical protein